MSRDLEKRVHCLSMCTMKKDWLTPNDLEVEYGFSKSTQAKMRMTKSKSNMPFSKIGRYIRYKREDINQWLEEHKIQGVM